MLHTNPRLGGAYSRARTVQVACTTTRPRVQQAVKTQKVALFVEPSPFSHVSGMKNRFECLIKCLRQEGDEVLVVVPDPQPPSEFCGAKVSAESSSETHCSDSISYTHQTLLDYHHLRLN